jgi:Flp pilus assembly protein TadB
MILLFLRRSSPRTRVLTGAILMATGVALVAMAIARSTGVPVHAIIVTVIGAIVLASGLRRLRRPRGAQVAR